MLDGQGASEAALCLCLGPRLHDGQQGHGRHDLAPKDDPVDVDRAGTTTSPSWTPPRHRRDRGCLVHQPLRPDLHNRQDVELVQLRNNGTVASRQRVTSISNETEADPLLGGVFIGDYLEVTANRGRAWMHYNANERHVALLGEGLPIPQQDNYLTRVDE
jgi:hypothetical protein